MPKYKVPIYATFRKYRIVEAEDRYDAQAAGDGYGEEYGKILSETEWEFYDRDERDEIEEEI